MWCSLGTSTPPSAYTREFVAAWQRSQASKSCWFTRWKSSTDLDRSASLSTTYGRNSQSHSTIVWSGASGYIRWTITWSGTMLRKTWGRTVTA